MEIWIKYKNLIDFPYGPVQGGEDGPFSFDKQKVTNMVSEIMYASPTCYLVSGYRGAGKTSFIKRVQEKCLAEVNLNKDGPKGVLFVYSSFSRFESKTYFLRKIIRDFREAVTGWDSKNNQTCSKELNELYVKTFNEIKKERTRTAESEKSSEVSLETKDFFRKLFLAFLPLVGPLIFDLILTPAFQLAGHAIFPYLKFFIHLGSIAWGILNAIKVTVKYNIKNTNSEKITATSLSDDDITEYDLEHVLEIFYKQNYKIVFVLDELDKIEDGELDQLLREMKPWLVRGKADFILVAGQRLTMKYYSLKERDDELLASLFSKIIHINPLTEQQLSRLFKDFLILGVAELNQAPDQKPMEQFNLQQAQLAFAICNSLIYRSKRLPRSFMNLIRQELQWRDGQAFLPVPDINFKIQETKMNILRKMFEKLALNGEIAETGKSHIIMQLFRASSMINERGRSEFSFNDLLAYIINPDNKTEQFVYPYLYILPFLKSCLEEFYQEAINEEILRRPHSEIPPDAGSVDEIESALVPRQEAPITDSQSKDMLEMKARKDFITEFDTFVSLLLRLAPQLLPNFEEKAENTAIDELFTAYEKENILHLRIKDSVVLKNPISYYRMRLNQIQAFESVYDLFTMENLSFNDLLQKVFRHFTLIKLVAQFGGNVSISKKADTAKSASEKEISDFKVFFPTSSGDVNLLFDFKYIDGVIAITSEEIGRAIAILDDYNIMTGRGNYYISIIFFKNYNGLDESNISMSAHYQIEKSRPDLAGKIRYLVVPIFTFDLLTTSLSSISDNISTYSLIPIIDKSKVELKTGKPTKRNKAEKKSERSSQLATDPEDPQKGKWGGKAVNDDRELLASVHATEKAKWFNVRLKVRSLSDHHPLTGKVTFYLHDSFTPDKYTVIAKDNIAEINDLFCYEAFTVGVSCDNNTTRLELDLNELAGVPNAFKY